MRIRNYFLTGLVILAPIGISLAISYFLFLFIGNLLGQVIQKILPLKELPSVLVSLMGFISLILLITLLGFLTPSFLGRWILGIWEWIILRIPVIKTLYTPAKVLMRNIFTKKSSFGKPVFIPYPREGVYTLVFVTSDAKWTILKEGTPESGAREGISVFLPTNPNPTTGLYTIVPENFIMDPNLSKEWGIKIAISGGVLIPNVRWIPKLGHS